MTIKPVLQENYDVEIVVPLKCLSNFRRLDIPLINCEVSLTLTWSENCVITSKVKREAGPDADPAVAGINNSTNATFKIHKVVCSSSYSIS